PTPRERSGSAAALSPASRALSTSDRVRIEPLDRGGLSRLEPLWLELHAHHQAVSPDLAPFVSDAASWAVRRELYEDVLAAGGFAFVARDGDADVAYALAGTEPAHWPATFATAAEYA